MPAAAKKVKETYATFRLLRDGYGSSWMMAGGDISCSAARHLRMEAHSELDTQKNAPFFWIFRVLCGLRKKSVLFRELRAAKIFPQPLMFCALREFI